MLSLCGPDAENFEVYMKYFDIYTIPVVVVLCVGDVPTDGRRGERLRRLARRQLHHYIRLYVAFLPH